MKSIKTCFMSFCIGALSVCNLTAQSNPAPQKNLARIEERVYAEAIENYSKDILRNPQNEEAYYNRGDSYYHLRRYAEALKDFSKAIELDATQSINYYKRGLVYTALKQYQESLWNFNKALELNPDSENYLADRAEAQRKSGRLQQALNDCKEALKVDNRLAKALAVRGMVRLDQGHEADAFKDLQQAVQIAPNEADFHLYLAEYYQKRGQTEKAIFSLSAAANLQRNNPVIYHQLATYKLSMGNDADAQKDAAQAIYSDVRYYPAFVIRGIAFANQGESGRYMYDLNKFFNQAAKGEDFAYAAKCALDYAKNNQVVVQAENWALKATQLESQNFDFSLLYANILFKLNKTTMAREIADKAIAIGKKKRLDYTQAQMLITKIEKESTDQTPPIIQIISPIVASNRGGVVVGSANKITVIGLVNDESGVEKVLINGNPARVNLNGNFDGETVLKDGQNIIKVQAYDTKGNLSEKTFNVSKDAEKPTESALAKISTGGKNYALIFAINEYDTWTPLVNPILDGRAVAKDLKEIYNFEVELAENVKIDDILLKIRQYATRKYEPNDQLFIYFAGHGQFDDVFREGYVVGKDSKFDDLSKYSYLSHTHLRTYTNNIPCKHIFLMLDICFGGTIDQTVAQRGQMSNFTEDRGEMIARKMRYTTRRYLTSGGKVYVPDGKPGTHSPFIHHFLEALRSEGGSDRVLTLDEILKFVNNTKIEPHKGEFGDNEAGSDFLFIAK